MGELDFKDVSTVRSVTGNAKVVLVEIARLAADDGMTPYVTNGELAEATGVTEPTARNAVNRLVDRGLVIRQGRTRPGGTRYMLASMSVSAGEL
jgi:DNA-binding Lrp family transcriptional regulator